MAACLQPVSIWGPSYKNTKSLTDWAVRQLAFLAQSLTCIRNKCIYISFIIMPQKTKALHREKSKQQFHYGLICNLLKCTIISWNHSRLSWKPSYSLSKAHLSPGDGALWPWQCSLSLHLSFSLPLTLFLPHFLFPSVTSIFIRAWSTVDSPAVRQQWSAGRKQLKTLRALFLIVGWEVTALSCLWYYL